MVKLPAMHCICYELEFCGRKFHFHAPTSKICKNFRLYYIFDRHNWEIYMANVKLSIDGHTIISRLSLCVSFLYYIYFTLCRISCQ